jgi:hypothetical protein
MQHNKIYKKEPLKREKGARSLNLRASAITIAQRDILQTSAESLRKTAREQLQQLLELGRAQRRK